MSPKLYRVVMLDPLTGALRPSLMVFESDGTLNAEAYWDDCGESAYTYMPSLVLVANLRDIANRMEKFLGKRALNRHDSSSVCADRRSGNPAV